MEDQNGVYDVTGLQYFEDIQKALYDSKMNYSPEEKELLNKEFPMDHQLLNINSNEENYVMEPEEFRYNPPDYLIFDENKDKFHDRFSDFEFRDESKVEHEHNQESGTPPPKGAGKTVRSHTKWESKYNNEDEPAPKQVLTNKERARIARKRKKQYYEDLEKKNKYLEEKVKQLTKEVKFYKSKAQKESRSSSFQSNDGINPKTISALPNECLNMMRWIPEDEDIFQIK